VNYYRYNLIIMIIIITAEAAAAAAVVYIILYIIVLCTLKLVLRHANMKQSKNIVVDLSNYSL